MPVRGRGCLLFVIALGAVLLAAGLRDFEHALQPTGTLELHESGSHVALDLSRGAGVAVAPNSGPHDGQRMSVDAWLLGAVERTSLLPQSACAQARAPDVRRRLLRHLKQHAHAGDDLSRA